MQRLVAGSISRNQPRELLANRHMNDARELLYIEVQFSVIALDWMQMAAPDHPEHGPTTTVQLSGNLLDRQPRIPIAKRFGWSESGIKQVREPVFHYYRFLANFAFRQVREKLNRRSDVD